MDLKSQALLAVWNSLRAETLQHMAGMDRLILYIPTVMLVLIGVSKLERFSQAIVVAAMFGAFAPYVIARQDLLIHRPAPVVKALEDQMQIQGWENHWKEKVKSGKTLVALDILSALPILVLFGYASVRAMLDEYIQLGTFAYLWLVFFGGCYAIYHVLKQTATLAS